MTQPRTHIRNVVAPQSQVLRPDAATVVKQKRSPITRESADYDKWLHESGFKSSAAPEDTVVVMDVSTSMDWDFQGAESKLDGGKAAIRTFAMKKARMNPAARMGLVSFNSDAQMVCGLQPVSTNQGRILSLANSLTTSGGTDIAAGLACARDLFDWSRKGTAQNVHLLTDGQGGNPVPVADELKRRGVTISVVGIGETPEEVDEELLKRVASVVDGKLQYWFITDGETLTTTFSHLATSARGH